MTTPATDLPPAPGSRPSRHRGWRFIAVVLSGAALAAGIGRYVWLRATAPQPPVVELAGVDRAIVAAVGQAQAAIRASPGSASAWGHLGMVLLTHDFTAEAIACFDQAERFDPGEPRWPYFLGIAHHAEDPNAAITELQRAVDLCDPTMLAPRIRLAEELLGQDRLEEAESQFRSVLQRDSSNAFALLGLGRLALRRGRPQEALAYSQRSHQEGGPRKATSLLLAEIYQQLGDKTAAAKESRRAAAFRDDPPRPDPFVEEFVRLRTGERANIKRAQNLLDAGRVPQTVRLLQQLVRDYPESASGWFMLGRALVRQRQCPAAEEALKKAIELAPENPENQVQMGIALYFQGSPGAELAFRKAIQLKPDCAPAYYNLGLWFMKQRDSTAAIDAFRAAVRLQPDLTDAYIGLGSQLASKGQLPEAVQHLQRAVELNPADPRAKQLLKQALLRITVPSLP